MIDVTQLLNDMQRMQEQRVEFTQLQYMRDVIIASLIIAQAIDRLTDAIKSTTSPAGSPPDPASGD